VRRGGLLNASLLAATGRLGHLDTFAVVDCGMPVPAGTPLIDLAVTLGTPPLVIVLDTLLAEVVTEQAVIADEAVGSAFETLVAARCPSVATVPHSELKALLQHTSFVVRTGEATPYANVLLRSGVCF
jgi:D-ribose pyranase